jgi:peroxiredoxin
MTDASKSRTTRRERRERARERRLELERRRARRRTLVSSSAVAVMLVLVGMVLFGRILRGGTGPAAPGQVQVSGPARPAPLAIGDRVPAFSAPRLGGGRVSWSEYSGSPVVLALWAPWCPHCQTELPILAKLAGQFPNVRLITIASAIGERSGPSPDEFVEDHHLTFPVAIDDANGLLARAFGLRYFPTVYFVSSDGTVLRVLEKAAPASTLRTLFAAVH